MGARAEHTLAKRRFAVPEQPRRAEALDDHPDGCISRPIPRVFQGEATDVSPSREPDLSCPIDVDERVVRDGTENCQEKFTKFFRESAGPVGRSCIPPARPSRADTVCDRAAWCVVSAAVRVVFSLR
jgi:hypothetical protein